MRILAFSDISVWEGHRDLIDRHKPDIVTLAGDLTSDGHASFWDALQYIPEFREQKNDLLRKYGFTDCGGAVISRAVPNSPRLMKRWKREGIECGTRLQRLKEHYERKKVFSKTIKRLRKIHVVQFYDFLEYAGKVSRVLVIKGDHDDDFPGDYDARRIERIPGCRESSGKACTINGCVFLGLGFAQVGYRRPLRTIIADFKGRVEIVIAHAPQRNVRLLAELEPRLIIRGHFGGGKYLIDGVPGVFTSVGHTIIKIGRKGLPLIRQYPAESWPFMIEDYAWLQPYPMPENERARHSG